MDLTSARWRKSSFSNGGGQCVEVASVGAVRDSKNAAGPALVVNVDALLAAVKAGRFVR